MQKESSYQGNATKNQEATTRMKLLFGWRWIVRVWAVGFLPALYILIMIELDDIIVTMFGLLSLFLFMTYPYKDKGSNSVARETRMIEIFVSRAEDPAFAFEKMITKMRKTRRVPEDDLHIILNHFSKRDDAVGQVAREKLNEMGD
jgi:hypothetical protein